MYDTIGIFYQDQNANRDINLDTGQEVIDRATGEISMRGYIKNLTYTMNSKGIFLKGSLSKYLYDNNLQSLTRSETQKAVEKLSNEINIPIDQATVYRLDIAQNFIMQNPVSEYLIRLGQAVHYNKTNYSNQNLLYKNSKRELSFYDKIKDCKRQKIRLPELYQGRHVLRYELRFKSRLHVQFNREIKVKDLYDQDFYVSAVDYWYNEYFKIQKLNECKGISMKNVKELEKSLAMIGIETIGGQDIVIEQIKNARQKGDIGKLQYQRQKDKVREIAKLKITESSDPINELDTKVKQAVQYYR